MGSVLKKYGFAAAAFAVSFTLLFVWRTHCSLYADDYMYTHEFLIDPVANENYLGERITDISQACESTWTHYMTNNGRLASQIVFFLMMLPKGVTDLLSALAVGAMPFLILIAAGGFGALRKKLAVVATAAAAWLVFPWSDGMQSFDFLLNYVFAADFMLAFIIVGQRAGRLSRGALLCAIPLGLIAAWMHEGVAIPLAAWMFFDLIVNRSNPRRRLILSIGIIAGLALCISPGTLSRLSDTMSGEAAAAPTNFAMLLGYRAILLFIILSAAAYAVPKWRVKVDWRRIMPIVGATAVATAMILVIGTADRGIWFALLFAMVGIVDLMLRVPLKTASWVRYAATVVIAALYLAFMQQLIKWQAIFGDERDAVHAELVGGRGVVYRDLVPENSMPWWTLGIPLSNMYRDWYNLYFEGQAAPIEGRTLRNHDLPLVVPARFEGKPFAEWDTIAGNSGLRGEGHLLLSNHPVDCSTLMFEYGEPTSAMNPLNRTALALLGGWERKSQAPVGGKCFYAGKVGEDSVWMLFPAPEKRFFRGRPILGVNRIDR